ncbi:MAG: phenylalanine--tRNA ligase subunit beta [Acidobacteria bacterium]|nr:phenylalanine--tRNA ligase subunit beta [Acidobacteriota bacterium]
MKILLSWLQEFVSLPTADTRQLADELSMLGFPVDAVSTEDGETILELDITTNRPDCLSHYGVARELAAYYGAPLTSFAETATGKPRIRRRDPIVRIAADDLCHRYCARIIRDVTVGPSPDWLARRLERVGVRSINNVADATNYILMAYGHPLHAFDLNRLAGGKIIVRRAADGELFTTLDGVERKLSTEDLVIADMKRAVALAGVMGGFDTEISLATRNVLLESAWFDPVAVRRTAKRQGMHTEASHRFERGADIEAALPAANRCIEMIQELAGGTVDGHISDVSSKPHTTRNILLRRSELARHLGLEIPTGDVERILRQLGFSPQPKGRNAWKCAVPSYRVDCGREIDLVEEVARHYGYDRFPLRLPPHAGQPAQKVPRAAKEERVRALLLALGYDETLSAVLVGQETQAFSNEIPVALANPLSEEASQARTSLMPNLLAAVQWNLNRGQKSVRLFEIGSVYRREGDGFQEPAVLGIAATGDRVEATLGNPARAFDFYDLKGDLEQLAELFAVASYDFDSENLPGYYRGGSRARLVAEGKTMGQLGELDSEVAARWKFRQPVYIAEVSLESLYEWNLRSRQAQLLSRFPAVERDFSLWLPKQVRFAAIRDAITSLQIPGLVAVVPVELFHGTPQVPAPAGKYGLLLRVTLQSQETTLTEAELQSYSSRIMECLEQKLGAQIRM